MAKKEHRGLLRQGAAVWNAWRLAEPEVRPDLAEADLSNVDLSALRAPDPSGDHVTLTNEQLLDTTYEETRYNLSGANLRSARLTSANMTGAILDGANLEVADMAHATLSLCSMRRANLSLANLEHAVIRHAMLSHAHLSGAVLAYADLAHSDLSSAELSGASLANANLREAFLAKANMEGVTLDAADLTYAYLTAANLWSASLVGSILNGTNLERAQLVGADLQRARLSGCRVHGVAAWDLKIDGATQDSLVITPDPLFNDVVITTDDIQIAQFLHLLIENSQLRKVIDSIAMKVVLILGRFTPGRKAVLDGLREELKRCGYVAVVFDFDKPASRDLTETISVIAHLSRFVIADLSDAKSVPQELSVIVPHLPSVPVLPLLVNTDREYGMFEHFARYPWVLSVYRYENAASLLLALNRELIPHLEAKATELSGTSRV